MCRAALLIQRSHAGPGSIVALMASPLPWPSSAGRGELVVWLGRLPAFGFWLRELEVLGHDRPVCAISVMGAARDGVAVSTRVISVFDDNDGTQIERWIYRDDLAARETIFRL